MIVFPNAKLNLGLHITGKRPDGYHDLETVFYPLPFYDILEILPGDHFEFILSGAKLDGSAGDNLCVKAYRLLKQDFPELPELKIFLYKNIPAGAGLGGGSADGAFLLSLLNTTFQLGLSPGQLGVYALRLGSDCPFFILNKPCLATGRGEILSPVSLNLSAYSFVLVNPGIHIPTGRAFSRLALSPPVKSMVEIIEKPPETWKGQLKNDFEEMVLQEYPELNQIGKRLYEAGAVYVSMTGSGSCFYGIFPGKKMPRVEFQENYRVIYP